MPCPICGSDPADYLCTSCKRNVCFSCARTVGKAVFCAECLENRNSKPKEAKNRLETTFVYSLIMTVGLGILFLVGDFAIFGMLASYSSLLPDETKSLVSLLRGTSVMIVGGFAAVTVILFIASKLKKKPVVKQAAV